MSLNKEQEKQLENVKNQVKKIKIFYLHLALYIIVVALIALNFYVMQGPYTRVITGLNISVLVFWTVFISIHAWRVFKGKILFRKSWEDRKIEEIINKKEDVETTFWE